MAVRPPEDVPWIMVETLAPDIQTVVSVGGEPRDFAPLDRSVKRLTEYLKSIPDSHNPMVQRKVRHAVDTARRTGNPFEQTLTIAAAQYLLLALPVPGPNRQVHAVQFWLGPHTGIKRHPSPRRAAGVVWDLPRQVICQPIDSARLSGVPDDEYVPEVSIAEIFDRASQFDRHQQVLDLIYNPAPGDKTQFEVTVPHMEGILMRWQVSIRARDDDQCKGAWWMWEDITSDQHPPRYPTLEQVGYRAVHRNAGTHVAVVMVAYSTIPYWLTDPAPWIRWNYLSKPTDVFHPDDRRRLWELAAQLEPGQDAEVVVHTLTYEGDYAPTRILLSPYPGYTTGRRLMIGQFMPADADQPRVPLEPPADISFQQVGHDEQMQRRLARYASVPANPGEHWSQTRNDNNATDQ
jgi:hypothetical protein